MSLNKQIAAQLWERCGIVVDRFHAKPSRRENVTFLGFADITLDASATIPGLKLKLRGVEVKVLKGNPHIDMPSEKGADGKYYPTYFPLTAELREVMVQNIFRTQHVASAIEAAAQLPVEGSTAPAAAPATAGANPFA